MGFGKVWPLLYHPLTFAQSSRRACFGFSGPTDAGRTSEPKGIKWVRLFGGYCFLGGFEGNQQENHQFGGSQHNKARPNESKGTPSHPLRPVLTLVAAQHLARQAAGEEMAPRWPRLWVIALGHSSPFSSCFGYGSRFNHQETDRRCSSLLPLTRVPFGDYLIFEPRRTANFTGCGSGFKTCD